VETSGGSDPCGSAAGNIKKLSSIINFAFVTARRSLIVEDVTARSAAEDFLRHLAATHALTGPALKQTETGLCSLRINTRERI
jgi:hypothetical protein